MHDFLSSITSYGVGTFALLASADMTSIAAFAGFLLVVVRIAGDLPKAIEAWQKLLGDKDDGSDDG